MRISFNTLEANFVTNVGYGVAGFGMVSALQRLGHEVPFRDASAPVEIAFCQPGYFEWSNPDAYHILYVPWESTILPPGWLAVMNAADEVWTPSDVVAGWFGNAGVTTKIFVYEHGIGEDWYPHHRTIEPGQKLRILSHGSPAVRKNTQMTVDAFHTVFGSRDDVELTIKSNGYTDARAMDGENIIGTVEEIYNNVKVRRSMLDEADLISLYHDHHALVYPSWGEGFGLIPLQGIASGMPTITVPAWAPYRKHLLPCLQIESSLVDSPWQHMHPGKMFEPSFESLCTALATLDLERDHLFEQAYARATVVHTKYDWTELTRQAFAHVVTKS